MVLVFFSFVILCILVFDLTLQLYWTDSDYRRVGYYSAHDLYVGHWQGEGWYDFEYICVFFFFIKALLWKIWFFGVFVACCLDPLFGDDSLELRIIFGDAYSSVWFFYKYVCDHFFPFL